MRTIIALISVATAAMTSVAAGDTSTEQPTKGAQKQETKESYRVKVARAQMRQFGGFVNDVRAQRGKLVIVNAQTEAGKELLQNVADRFAGLVKITAEVTTGTFDLANPEQKGEATVYVVDDPKLPMSLVAPEAKWAMVNVATLKSDKSTFFAERVKKQLTRGVAYVLGAADSSYPNCLLGCVTKAEDLDQFLGTRLPVDVEAKFAKYVPGLGFVPYKRTTYRKSVEEGWGPQPTNEFQKAIWDEIHTLPTKPITIEPETK